MDELMVAFSKYKKKIALGVLVLFSVITLFSSYYVVDSGTVVVVKTVGKYSTTPSLPGVNWKIPYIQTVTPVNTKIIAVNYKGKIDAGDKPHLILLPSMQANDKNNVHVEVDLTLQYRIIPAKASAVLVNYGIGYNYFFSGVNPIVEGVVKEVLGKEMFENLNKKRGKLSSDILSRIKAEMVKKNVPVFISSISLRSIYAKNKNIRKRIALVQAAKQKAAQATREQTRKKTEATTKKIEVETAAEAELIKQQKKADAQLYKQQKHAEAIETLAKSKSKARLMLAHAESTLCPLISTPILSELELFL